MMTNAFVRLTSRMTVAQAFDAVRRTDRDADIPSDLHVVERFDAGAQRTEKLRGVISIRDLAMADAAQHVDSLMATHPVTVFADEDDDAAVGMIAKHKFLALPVLDRNGHLVGVIPVDDLMHVVAALLHGLYARGRYRCRGDAEGHAAAGGETARAWLLGTMVLELGAGLVIAHFNHVLEKVILLASFMPVISAIAGNVGLQAAAITVRALDSGKMSLRQSGTALAKEGAVTLLMGVVCAAVLGGNGVIWSKHLMFGVVIAMAPGCSADRVPVGHPDSDGLQEARFRSSDNGRAVRNGVSGHHRLRRVSGPGNVSAASIGATDAAADGAGPLRRARRFWNVRCRSERCRPNAAPWNR